MSVSQFLAELQGRGVYRAAALYAAGAWALLQVADVATPMLGLPFVNMSGLERMDYLGDGLAEDVLNQLAQLRGFKVVARTSSFYFKGKKIDIQTVGERLGVGHVLEGSVRQGLPPFANGCRQPAIRRDHVQKSGGN